MEYQVIFGAFFLASAIIALFLILILFSEKKLEATRWLLLALLAAIILLMIDSVVIALKIFQQLPHLLFLFSSLWLAIPSFLFLYSKYYSKNIKAYYKIDLLHFMPVGIYFLVNTNFYFLPAESKAIIGEKVYGGSGSPGWFAILFFGLNYIYIIWLYHSGILTVDIKKKKWIISFWWLWLFVVVFDSLLSLWALTGKNVSIGKDISILCFSFQAFFIAYHVLKKPTIFFPKNKYDSTSVSQQQLDQIALEAVALIQNEKLYLNTQLRQQDFAKKLGTNSVVLSQVLSTAYQQNFNEWVNAFRVEYAKQLLLEGFLDTYSVEALAEKSGYASKVSFYRNFKKLTGLTPTEFFKQEPN